ncbi:MAG: ribosome hibernation-promoting factor, HPF/YfiA family [Luteibaculum sp.]
MEVKVHSIHFDADVKLLNFIQEKVNKLRQFDDKIMAGEVFLRLDKSDNKENKITEIKLNVPGKDLFAKRQCKSFEEATDNAVEALRKQIRKHKAKLNPMA